jgi:hypothetical protein
MKTIIEPSREIPVRREVDVLVVGGGPAGTATAISAARQGQRVLLLEQTGMAGGVATGGLMSHWTGSTAHIGIYGEILARAQDCPDPQVIHPEKLRSVLLEMLLEAGVEVQFYTFACDAVLAPEPVDSKPRKRLAGVISESKAGREAVLAKVTVDASGDGDIAARSGVPFHKGRESDGRMQPMTLMFKVGGVDTTRVVKFVGGFEDTYAIPGSDIQTLARQQLPHPAGHLLIYRSSLPGVVTCNMTNAIEVDGTKPEDLTRAEVTCRRQLGPILEFLSEQVRGFENCYLLETAAQIGVRETRHFEGLYTLTEEDILAARVFEDWAAPKVHFNFDVHNLAGSGLDSTGVQKHFQQARHYTIPYRCLVPKQVDGLLLAGRNISGTHKAHSNFRVMPVCAMIGQAAGTAAALCAQQDIQPRELDVREMQRLLRTAGVSPD